ncbi:hypothetical protein MJO28_001330 [Puccinia striiformis f. sp. tritici]|uniref:Uncharacterized protein n=1 Tax=Puccinia striiformis f. sp. tritici TaxID=168172 RepID=A0ACC0EUB7_9BASI|nr:hypothetical protein MJO28_001330 [Puccinia striiformis f. sp. tritici]
MPNMGSTTSISDERGNGVKLKTSVQLKSPLPLGQVNQLPDYLAHRARHNTSEANVKSELETERDRR